MKFALNLALSAIVAKNIVAAPQQFVPENGQIRSEPNHYQVSHKILKAFAQLVKIYFGQTK